MMPRFSSSKICRYAVDLTMPIYSMISARLGDSPLLSRAYCLINSASFCSFSSLMTLISTPQTISELIVLLLYHGKDVLSIGLQNFLFRYVFFFVSCGAVSDGLHCRQNGRTRDLPLFVFHPFACNTNGDCTSGFVPGNTVSVLFHLPCRNIFFCRNPCHVRTSFVSTHHTMKTAGSPAKARELSIYITFDRLYAHSRSAAYLLKNSSFFHFGPSGTYHLDSHHFNLIFYKNSRFHASST